MSPPCPKPTPRSPSAIGLFIGGGVSLLIALFLALLALGVITLPQGDGGGDAGAPLIPGGQLFLSILCLTLASGLTLAGVSGFTANRLAGSRKPIALWMLEGASKLTFELGMLVLLGVAFLPIAGFVLGLFALVLAAGVTFAWKKFMADRAWRETLLFPWYPVFLCGLIAPGVALSLGLRRFLDTFPHAWPLCLHGPVAMAWYDLLVGFAGIAVGLVGAAVGSFWRLRQVRQIENLPTSTVRGAAIGLAELKGVARPLYPAAGDRILWHKLRAVPDGDGGSSVSVDAHLGPFYLEDQTGRILVDPTDAELKSPAGMLVPQMLTRVSEVVLTRRGRHPDPDGIYGLELRDGDPIYLLGSVEPRDDAPPGASGPDALVVRARREEGRLTPLWQLLFLNPNAGLEREFQHVFILSDASERRTRALFLGGWARTWLWSILWLAASLWLIREERARLGGDLSSWTAREIAAFAEGEARLEALLKRLDAPSPEEREVAVEALRVEEHPSMQVVLRILHRMEDPSSRVSAAAANTLWPLLNSWRTASPADSAALLPGALRLSQGRSWDSRYFAMICLGRIRVPPEEVIPAFTRALSDPHPWVRSAALSGLSGRGLAARGLGPALLALLGDESADVRRAAGWTLREAPFPAELETASVTALFSSPHKEVRAAAARILGQQTATPAVLQGLSLALGDPEAFVRESAAVALGELGPGAAPALPALAAVLADLNARVLYFSLRTLEGLGPLAAPVAPSLILLLQHKDGSTRRDAARVLGSIGELEDEARAGLEAAVEAERDDEVKQELKRALRAPR